MASATLELLSVGRKRFLHTVFTTALEGGINYWAAVDEYHWRSYDTDGLTIMDPEYCDIDGFYATIQSSERDLNDPTDTGWGIDGLPLILRIDLAVMELGVKRFRRWLHGEIDNKGKPVPEDEQKALADDSYFRAFLVAEASLGEDGDYDASVADEIVQWGLFGESVYG